MRVMVDTNIFISAALFPGGRVAAALFKAILPPYQPVVCDYVIDEIHRKFQEKFPHRAVELEAFLYMNAAEAVEWLSIPEEERPSTLAGVEKKLSAAPVKTNDP